MAFITGNDDRFEPARGTQGGNVMEELLSELLSTAGPWRAGSESSVQPRRIEASEPPEPFLVETYPSLQAEAARVLSPESEPGFLPDPPATMTEMLVELAVEVGRSVEPVASIDIETAVEAEAVAEVLPDELPAVEVAGEPDAGAETEPLLDLESIFAELVAAEPEPETAAESPVLAVAPSEAAPNVPEGPPSSGELDSLIAAIDTEVSAGPRLTFETSLDALSSAVAEKKNCIVFALEDTRYAVPISNVLEMDKIPRITPVPNVPAFVTGVTNLRGEIVSVIDLRVLLGLPQAAQFERGRILVVRSAGGQQTAALVVDEVRGIATIPLGTLKAPAGAIEDKVLPLLTGVCEYDNSLLNVLSLEKLLRSPEIHQLEVN